MAAEFLPARPQTSKMQAKVDKVGTIDNGQIKLGVNLDLGGAITYLSKSGSDVNVVNSFDWGRQIQMSHYSGPNPFTPNGKQPKKEWAGLGWNPIQSGDAFGNRSKIIDYKNDGKSIYVKCVPMQWPLDNETGECTFECWIHLQGKTAHVRSRLNNHRSDLTQYPGRSQELPAIYTNGPWYRLMTYKGDKPFTDDVLTEIPQVAPNAGFPWAHWHATENWAALVDNSGFGLGVWEPGVCSFIGGFAGKQGAGGPKDAPTGYIAPLHDEVIDHDIQYEYSYVLILDTLPEIRRYVTTHSAKERLPDYRFLNDRQHWHFVNGTDTGWPILGQLNIPFNGRNIELHSPSAFWKAGSAPTLVIEAAYQASAGQGGVYWKRSDAPEFSAQRHLTFDINPDGKFHTYRISLSASPEYRGVITGLRVDAAPGAKQGELVRIKRIALVSKSSKEIHK